MSAASTFNCSFDSLDTKCNTYGESVKIVPLNSCQIDMSSYLSSLGISIKRGVDDQSKLTEKDIILNRAGLNVDTDTTTMTICPKHRFELTTGWSGRRRVSCSHPLHKGVRRKMNNIRRVNAQMSQEILAIDNTVLPIGSGQQSFFYQKMYCYNKNHSSFS